MVLATSTSQAKRPERKRKKKIVTRGRRITESGSSAVALAEPRTKADEPGLEPLGVIAAPLRVLPSTDVVNLGSASLLPIPKWVETAEEVLLNPLVLARAEPTTKGDTIILAEGSEAFGPLWRLGKESAVEEEPTVKKEPGRG